MLGRAVIMRLSTREVAAKAMHPRALSEALLRVARIERAILHGPTTARCDRRRSRWNVGGPVVTRCEDTCRRPVDRRQERSKLEAATSGLSFSAS